jgi:hypothetical protein
VTRRASAIAALCLAALGGLGAHAHPDVMLVGGERLRLEPGQAVVRPMGVHFHRLVARWSVADPTAEGPWLLVVPAEAERAAEVAPEDAWFAARLDGGGRLQHLIDCCLGVDERHLLLILRHDGPAPVDLDLHASALHDEFAVVARRAEAGALEVPLTLFAALGVAALLVLARDRRRAGGPSTARPRAAAVAAHVAAALLVASLASALLLGGAGALRYGGGLTHGLIAVLADLPVPGGLFGSRAAFLLAWLLLAWVAAIAAWIVAVAAGAHLRSSRRIRVLGGALASISLGGALAMAAAYDGSLVPAVLGLVLAGPLAVTAGGIRRTQSGPGRTR